MQNIKDRQLLVKVKPQSQGRKPTVGYFNREMLNQVKDKAATYCANFYNPKGAADTSVEYLANGAESVIYKCQIGENDKLNEQVPEITGNLPRSGIFIKLNLQL